MSKIANTTEKIAARVAARFASSNEELATFPLASAIYRGRENRAAFLTHVFKPLGRGWEPLCGKVLGEHVLDDMEWDGPGSTERKATCRKCAKLDPRPHS